MPENLETMARRFPAEQSAAWSEVAALSDSLRASFLRQQEALLGDGSFQEGIRRIEAISRSLYRDVFAIVCRIS